MDENDPRLMVLSNYLYKRLTLKLDLWAKMLSIDEHKDLICDFLLKPEKTVLVFFLNSSNQLIPLMVFPQECQSKIIYFIKRQQETITEDNFNQVIIIGELSTKFIDELDVLLSEVFIPLIQNTFNKKRLSKVLSEDIEKHIFDFYSNVVQFKGVLQNQIVLPLPNCTAQIPDAIDKFEDSDGEEIDISLKKIIEDCINNWVVDIYRIMDENGTKIFNSYKHPLPNHEIEFWTKRSRNLSSILYQLKDEKVKKMIEYLILTESPYVKTFKDTLTAIIKAIVESNYICMFFKPLERHIQNINNTNFMDLEPLLLPMMNTLCVMWAYSKYYKETNLVFLLQEISNLFIEKAILLLEPNSIFDNDPIDVIAKVRKCFDILSKFRNIYSKCRDNIDIFYKEEDKNDARKWTFKENESFGRLDKFLDRLVKLEHFLKASLEFGKLEEIMFGCLNGSRLTAQIYKLFEEYQQISNYFNTLQCNPIDTEDDSFPIEILKFNDSCRIADEKLTTIFSKAFDDCNNLESCYKLLIMISPLLGRKNIRGPLSKKFQTLLNMINDELDTTKKIYDEGIENQQSLKQFLPTLSSEVCWILQLRQRISCAVEQFQFFDFLAQNKEYVEFMYKKYTQMNNILDNRRDNIIANWLEEAPNICNKYLSEPLIKKLKNGLLELNFNQEFATLLKDIKYLKNLSPTDLSTDLEQLFKRSEEIFSNRLMLNRITDWYNYIKRNLHPIELRLIENELNNFNDILSRTLLSMKWENTVTDEINEISHIIENLYTRMLNAKNNLNNALNDMKQWNSIPLYDRKREDVRKENLLNIQDSEEHCVQRYNRIRESFYKIIQMLEKNYRLFFDLPEDIMIVKIENVESSQSDSSKKLVKKEKETNKKTTQATDKVPKKVQGATNASKKAVKKKPIVEKVVNKMKQKIKTKPTDKDNKSQDKDKSIDKDKNKQIKEKADSVKTSNELPKTDSIKKTEGLTKWEEYKEYVDALVLLEFQEAVRVSFNLILSEMINEEKHGPLFEVRIELQEPKIVFVPDLEMESPNGFCSIIETILEDIVGMAGCVPRIDEKNPINYTDEVTEYYINNEMYDQILATVAHAVNSSLDFCNNNFDKYSYLWMDNRKQHLDFFLKYGKAIKKDDFHVQKLGKIKESPPKIQQFKEQFDFYEELLKEIKNIKSEQIIDGWLKVDLRIMRASLENYVIKWSYLFKQHLIDHVINTLSELNDFTSDAIDIFSKPIDENDFKQLLKIMESLNQTKDFELKTETMFESLKETIQLLNSYDYEFPDELYEKLESLPDKWLKTKKCAVQAKQNVAPLQANHITIIQKQINLIDIEHNILKDNIRRLPIYNANCNNAHEIINEAINDLINLETKINETSQIAKLFDIGLPEFKFIKFIRKELRHLKQLWDYDVVIRTYLSCWKETQWVRLDIESMELECKKFIKELHLLDKEVRNWQVYIALELLLKNMLTSLRAINELQNPALRERHWIQLMRATGVKIIIDDFTTLNELLNLNLHKYEEDVKNIVDVATKELSMEKMLKELKSIWSQTEFEFESHERTKIKILKVSEIIIETLEDNQVQLQNLLTSKLVSFFANEISEWQKNLSNADQVLQLWFEVQRKWLYLEAIFIDSEDIRQQLKEDAKLFDKINKEFKDLLLEIEKLPNIIKATNIDGLYPKLENLLQDLNICEKALNDYLEIKRLSYPRFYFISSADLLDILSKGQQPELVCRHLTKLYDNIAKLIFVTESGKITKKAKGMRSKDLDEIVMFSSLCDCNGYVELWLNNVTLSMQKTLRHLFNDAVISYENKTRELWIYDYPAQVALCATQIWWTAEVNQAFFEIEQGYENALKEYQKKQIGQLNALISLLLGDLTAADRQKIMTICTIDVHSRDVVAKMIHAKVNSNASFQWQSQLRHRWDTIKNDCFANICDAQFRYLYEYLGNTPRLVITPLTDRCYITLTQSLHLVMGGAPAGPAGTGKTETTKDLGRALGVMVYVFNCSEQMDYKSIGNIYKGLAQTGAWGCFDEFNRISVEVLSVVAVQVKCIQDAIKAKKSSFNFIGEEIKLLSTVGIFITMNPGYAGRTELPENLKALFRPCAMVVPDFELICEIMLVAEGFHDAKLLARKFITLYTLCRELLSKQDHYDWGLRAIKSVLVVAGFLKRNDRQRPEDQVLMRALRDFNLPKIVTDDVPVFMGLITDLFPALDVPRKRDYTFENVIKEATLELKLQPEENFILKVTQLEELFAVRHSVFIVGNAGTGKTMVWKTLNKVYQLKKQKPMYNDLNPKAVTNDELFGIIHPQTREWKDGLFSVIMRDQANLPDSYGPKWIVLDGDIDPMWIESLNTVMDDNKVLTLASNERIALTSQMRLLFEISNLRTATPATVSRAGILYINPQDLGWNPYITSWLEARNSSNERTNLQILFEKYIPPCLEALRTKFKKITPLPEITHVQMLCCLLDCLLTEKNVTTDCPKEWYEIYFVFASVWAFGSTMFQDQLIDWRSEFSRWWCNEFKHVKFPSTGTVFHYYVDNNTKKFVPWKEMIEPFVLDIQTPLQNAQVDIIESIRIKYFMSILVERNYPFMLVGPAGTGKTALIRSKLNNLPENYLVTNISFNFYTTSEMVQKVLEKNLERKTGKNFGPPLNKKLIAFIDDLNMPQVDNYGTAQPHTLIRQFMDYKHWYDRAKLTIKEIHNVQFVSAMNPTAGSFTIDPRLLRHFCVFSYSFPSSESLLYMYTSILSQHIASPLNKFNQQIQKIVEPLVNTAIILHQKVVQTFLPTAIKFHYLFNLRDLTNIFQGLLFANGDVINSSMDLVRLWFHESTRVYGDKMMEKSDNELLRKLIIDISKKNIENIDTNLVLKQPLVYCHFSEAIGDDKYGPINDWSHLKGLLDEALRNYNDIIGVLDLVLFEDAILHVCRISRILHSSYGNGLMVGVGGSGKQSLTRLGAFISSLEVFQIQISKGYSVNDFKTDLAQLYLKVGLKNIGTVLLVTDSQVTNEKFLVLINDMLSTGDIPDLFTEEETENIINTLKNEVKTEGLIDTKENCWNYFIGKIRRLLKIVLCFSPIGNVLRNRARKFPAIVNCTAINWFYEWPQEALKSVSIRFLKDLEELPHEVIESVSNFMSYVHTSVNKVSEMYYLSEKRYNYTTPKSFLEQIFLYSKLLKEKTYDISSRIERLENGLEKLACTSMEVDGLKEVLAVQEEELMIKNEAADRIIKVLCEENEKVASEQAIATEEEAKVKVIEEDVKIKADICAEDLAKAEPALIAAQEALQTLNKTNLTELKSFPTPPPAVVNVTAAVMVLLSKKGVLPKDRSWKACKVMMGKVDQFLNELIKYNKENIHPDIVKEVTIKYISDATFKAELILNKSVAAAGLCAWVINIIKFYEVYAYVEPKRLALNAANQELLTARNILNKLKTKLSSLEEQLGKLKAEFEVATNEKLKCQAEADATTASISLANRLVHGLASENIRWKESVLNLQKSAETLPGDMLLVTAFISYMGCFTRNYRFDLLNNYWIPYLEKLKPQIPYDKTVDLLFLLKDEAQIAQWNNEGLPNDRMSAENAAILTSCSRWPLMIDPQLQGIKWIKNKYKDDLIITRLSSKSYLNVIEKAIESGQTVLLENIEENLDAVLDPILGRNLIKKGRIMKVGDKELDYNSNFRLILHTKLANPHYKPELQAQTTLVNFTVTRDGLEDQLLAEIVKIERPDLEKIRFDLNKQRNDFKITLKFLEDDLLHKLSMASENILQDLELVENLETTKKTAAEIEKKAAEAWITSKKIDDAREQYRPVAKRAAMLYFILNDLYKINVMYQFSLKAFCKVFKDAISRTPSSDNLKTRVINLTDSITYSVFLYTTRSLFEVDKLTFLTQMTFQILLDLKEIDSEDLNYLLRFTALSNEISPVDFISNTGWGKIKTLSQKIEFVNLDKSILGSANRWRKLVESEYPEKEKFPEEWKNKNALEKLCMIRALRPDRTIYALKLFIEDRLGSKYVQGRQMKFSKSFSESNCYTPIFFILSPGVDPLKDVEKLGNKLGYTFDNRNFHNVSLGQGQEQVAEQAIDNASEMGHWVILQNIHLVLKWLPILEKKMTQDNKEINKNFRLFISAEPPADPHETTIPQGILETSIKITNEPPSGMQANLHKALDNFTQETLELSTKETEFKAILFALCYFHAAIAGRTKFGSQGWNRSYPFNFGDLTISVNVLCNYLEINNRVPWEDIRYLFGEIMYGGHITDDWDRRLCRTYLLEYLKPDLIDGNLNFAPNFRVPHTTDYKGYHNYIDENLPQESPYLYGLHPNAEIDFLTNMSDNLFRITLEMQPRSFSVSESVSSNKETKVKQTLDEIIDRLPDAFVLSDLMSRAEDKTPYVIVALQECDRMNMLINEIRTSLKELELGLKGELTYSKNMEDLEDSLFMNQIPSTWQRKAYPSTFALGSWFADMLLRYKELDSWTLHFLLPATVWLGGLFNPQSFLTAIMQQTARKNEWPLDKMCLNFDVTKKQKDDFTTPPREGAYIHGLFMEGARWSIQDNSIVEPKLKELYPLMPVIFLRAITQDKLDLRGLYECPVYKTKVRGPTFVWTFNLKTKESQTKWVIAGVAILLQA